MADDSGYYAADEATRRLARKRQLARLLEEQSLKPFQLANPNARASWANVAAPLTEALIGRWKGEEADKEGKAQEAADRQAQIDWWKANGPQPDLPARPDMNLPGDLRALAGAPEPTTPPPELPAAPPPSPLAAQMVRDQAAPPPTAAPSDLTSPLEVAPDIASSARNPMAQLLAGPQQPSLGDQMLGDQANAPTMGALKPEGDTASLPPLVPKFGGAPAGPSLVPKLPDTGADPSLGAFVNVGGTPEEKARAMAAIAADMQKSGITGPTQFGAPPSPGALPAAAPPPPLVPQPPAAAVTPPPSAGPALLPNGQIDMAPQGLQLPAQKGKRGLDAFEMVNAAMVMPPGRARDKFVDESLKNMLTEPDRRLAKEELDQRRREETQMKERIAAAAEAGKTQRTGMQQEGAGARTAATNKSREQIAADRLAAIHNPSGSEATPEAISDAAALFRKTGVMPALGWDKETRRKILNEWSSQMREDGQTVDDQTTAAAEFKALTSSQRQLTQRSEAIEAGAKKIHNDFATLETQIDRGNFGAPKIINTPVNKLRGLVSDPDLGALNLAAQVVGTEYERMMTGGLLSIAQLHEGAREDARRLLNGDMSPAEMRSVMDVMKTEIENQRNSWKDQLSEIKDKMKNTGRPSGGAAPAGASSGKTVVSRGKDEAGNRFVKYSDGTVGPE
jgi:hypothetical protein